MNVVATKAQYCISSDADLFIVKTNSGIFKNTLCSCHALDKNLTRAAQGNCGRIKRRLLESGCSSARLNTYDYVTTFMDDGSL